MAARCSCHLSSHAGHPRPATSDTTKGSQAPPADSLKESQLAARSGPSPRRRTSPTTDHRSQTASLEAAVPLPSCPARDEQPSLPARCAAPGRRPNRPGVDRAARDHPGDHRVRVPHLAGPKLIASPDGSRDLRDDVEHATSTTLVGGQSLRTLYGFGDVRNISAAPKPDLVAEDPKSAGPPTANGAVGHDAPVLAAPVVDRRLLDDVRRPEKLHL